MKEGYYKEYSYIYDNIYSNKNYKKEFDFILKYLKRFSPKSKTILDLGCGTGSYTQFFAKKNYQITGVDISKSMIDIAKKKIRNKKNVSFIVKDIRKLKLKKKFDIVVSLFDVLSFLKYKNDANTFFKNLNLHLKKNGIAIFDFWSQSAVEKLKPLKRTKIIKNNGFKYIKSSNPVWFKEKKIIKVHFSIKIVNKKDKVMKNLQGKHYMKYYNTKYIEKLAKKNKFKIMKFLTLSSPKIKKDSWSVLAILRKN